MTSPDRELLSQSAAQQLLRRAGQIDVDTTTVESLRAAAREAGISDAAFDAALAELRSQEITPPMTPHRKRKALGLAVTVAAGAVMLLAIAILPNRGAPRETMESLIDARCIPVPTARDIAARMAKYDGSDTQIEMVPGSTKLKVRGTRQPSRTSSVRLRTPPRARRTAGRAPNQAADASSRGDPRASAFQGASSAAGFGHVTRIRLVPGTRLSGLPPGGAEGSLSRRVPLRDS